MKRFSLVLLAALVSVLGLALTSAAATAQDKYPNRPIKVIVPYAPGGATDIVARVVGEEMAKLTGQGFVVLNKPGANGQLAIEEMARSTPDGYTLMIGNVTTNAIAPILYGKKFNINYEKDVVPVTRLVDIPAFLLVTAKDFEPKTLPEFIAYAKKNPGKVSYGTVGIGSYPHYDMAYFAKRAGDLDLVGLPNKAGASGVITDMLRGDVHAAFLNVASTAGMVQSGQLRAIALVNHQRLPEYPNVPTMKEAGYPNVGTLAWQGLFAPSGTPQPILETLFKSVTQAMQGQAAKDNFKKQNFNIVPNQSLAESKSWLASEMKTWKEITDAVKIDVGQ